jgi:predicted phosphodiesterase
MKKILQKICNPIIIWASKKFHGAPKREAIFKALSRMMPKQREDIRGVYSLNMNLNDAKYIIFSDHHKGNGDEADDFKKCEKNYLEALLFYKNNGFTLVNLGDSEEFWKYEPREVLYIYKEVIEAEAAFYTDNNYIKIYGNHDTFWKNPKFVKKHLGAFFKNLPNIYEGFYINFNDAPLNILITHGHQGDLLSENNSKSIWIVRNLWAPVQRFLHLNVNSPSQDPELRHKHNKIMYEWASAQINTVLIAGHTHNAVFASGRYSNHESNYIGIDKHLNVLKPNYFNTGCCCNNSESITGIEIENGEIKLVKWNEINGQSTKETLECSPLKKIIEDLGN